MSKNRKILIIALAIIVVAVVIYFAIRKKNPPNTQIYPAPKPPAPSLKPASGLVSDLSNGLDADYTYRRTTYSGVAPTPSVQVSGVNAAIMASSPYAAPLTQTTPLAVDGGNNTGLYSAPISSGPVLSDPGVSTAGSSEIISNTDTNNFNTNTGSRG